MLTIAPDFARRIDLAGVGPCPRPVDIDCVHTGFAHLVSLRVYSFAADSVIAGEAEGDEVFVVAMRGQADIGVDVAGTRVADVTLRADGGDRAVYLPPHSTYWLAATTDCDIAYARVRPQAGDLPAPRGFPPADGRLRIVGHATAMDLTLATVHAGEERPLTSDDGRWPERFVHIRTYDTETATISGEAIGDWASVVLGEGERATLAVTQGSVDVLVIAATVVGMVSAKGTTDER